jgi:ribose transport system permease protein
MKQGRRPAVAPSASVFGGICNNSGGALIDRGPAYTQMTLFARIVAMVEIDLSVGGIATASSLAALLIKFYHVDPWIAVAIAFLAGLVLGGLNGVLTGVLKVPLIIVSLGTLSAYFGLHLILSDGKAVCGLPKDHPFFTWLGGDLFELPVSVWMSIGCAIVLYFVFVHTQELHGDRLTG